MKPIKLLALILVALIATVSIDAEINGYIKQNPPERPVVNLPVSLRQINWSSRRKSGSCTWASVVSLLRWEERYELANWIRRNKSGGVWLGEFGKKLDQTSVDYAIGHRGDITFLAKALETRRGVAVPIKKGKHMVILVHLDAESACILDNNHPKRYDWMTRDEFIKEWRKAGGYAFVPTYSPMAPLP